MLTTDSFAAVYILLGLLYQLQLSSDISYKLIQSNFRKDGALIKAANRGAARQDFTPTICDPTGILEWTK